MSIPIVFNDEYLNRTENKDLRKPGERYKLRCWHETGNSSGSPHRTLQWNLHTRSKTGQLIQSSYDVMIARDGEIWRYVDWTEWNSWSEGVSSWTVDGKLLTSGPLGRACLGIELDGANDGKQKATAAQIESAARFAIYTAETEGIPLDGDHDVTHAQIAPGRKTDPRGYAIDQVYEAIRSMQQLVTPDFGSLWGPYFSYFSESGIAAVWRDHAAVLQAAVSDETKDAKGRVWRLFERGAVSFDPITGGTEVYVPRGKS